jgi:PII-like signaling protein
VRLSGPAKLLRIHVGEADRYEGRPLHLALVEFFRARGIAGATVLRGIEGYGTHAIVHAVRIFELSSDLPMVVEVIDEEARIRAILPEVRAMVREGLITLETVEVVGHEATAPQG